MLYFFFLKRLRRQEDCLMWIASENQANNGKGGKQCFNAGKMQIIKNLYQKIHRIQLYKLRYC